MPRPFSENELTMIREDLMRHGKRLFGQFGLKKTSVDDIVQAAGISKGAFYKFFISKEDLLFNILKQVELDIQSGIMERLASVPQPKEQLAIILLEQYRHTDNELIVRMLTDKKEYELFYRKLSDDQKKEMIERDSDFAGQLIGRWLEEGILKIQNPELISSLLRSIFFISLHKDEIGGSNFDEVMTLLINGVVDQIFE